MAVVSALTIIGRGVVVAFTSRFYQMPKTHPKTSSGSVQTRLYLRADTPIHHLCQNLTFLRQRYYKKSEQKAGRKHNLSVRGDSFAIACSAIKLSKSSNLRRFH